MTANLAKGRSQGSGQSEMAMQSIQEETNNNPRPSRFINKISQQASSTNDENERIMSKTARDYPEQSIFPKGGGSQFMGASDSESVNLAVPSSVSQAMGGSMGVS